MKLVILVAAVATIAAAPAHDLVTDSLPGFPPAPYPFKLYSGFLNVSGPVAGYDSLVIHYQFHESMSAPATNPVVAWHTGGPGGSSLYGQWAETGYFQVAKEGTYVNAASAWNNIANTLFLESPAGAFLTPDALHSGFSYCLKGGERQQRCSWNDVTQAEAYEATLKAWFAAFPEHAGKDLYLAGESYAGQYIPNIAAKLLNGTLAPQLKGIAVGNGCWGGAADSVLCNGPNEARDLLELYHGKGLISTELYGRARAACAFPDLPYTATTPPKLSRECKKLIGDPDTGEAGEVDTAVGPLNPYSVYDDCEDPAAAALAAEGGKSPRWLAAVARTQPGRAAALFNAPPTTAQAQAQAARRRSMVEFSGGYTWSCGTFDSLPKYFERPEVRKALNLPAVSRGSTFEYDTSGPASVTLYPQLINKIRVLIYNGDADTVVPYLGNEEWTSGVAKQAGFEVAAASHPWFHASRPNRPAGSATAYKRPGADADESPSFNFVTLRLAGHEVPHFEPEAAFAMISRFLTDKPW